MAFSIEQDRAARALNEVVSESEPECFAGVSTVNSEEGRVLVKKRRMAIRRKAARWRAKLKGEQRFLSRKVSKRTSKISQDCPTIRPDIESFKIIM